MKLINLLNNRLHEVMLDLRSQKLPVKAAYAINGIQKNIEKELIKYEEIRKDLITKYAKRDSAGSLIVDENDIVQFEDNTKSQFVEEMNELLDIDIDVGKLTTAELGNSVLLTADEIAVLDGILVD